MMAWLGKRVWDGSGAAAAVASGERKVHFSSFGMDTRWVGRGSLLLPAAPPNRRGGFGHARQAVPPGGPEACGSGRLVGSWRDYEAG